MADSSIAAPVRRRHVRRRWWILAVVLTVLVVAAAVVTGVVRHLDGQYGPLSGGSVGGVGQNVVPRKGGVALYRLDTVGNGTGVVYGSLEVGGEHTVRITGVDADEVTVRAQWAPWPTDEDVAVPQKDARWRDFPAVVGRGIVQLRYEIRRPPSCQDRPMRSDEGAFYSGTHTVHWESLLGDHSMVVGHRDDLDVQIC